MYLAAAQAAEVAAMVAFLASPKSSYTSDVVIGHASSVHFPKCTPVRIERMDIVHGQGHAIVNPEAAEQVTEVRLEAHLHAAPAAIQQTESASRGHRGERWRKVIRAAIIK